MTTTKIQEIRERLNAAAELDYAENSDPLGILNGAHVDAVLESISLAELRIFNACECAIKEAAIMPGTPAPEVRKRVCAVCTGMPHAIIHHVAEAIFSGAGLPDALAWDAGNVGVYIDLEAHNAGDFGQQITTVVR